MGSARGRSIGNGPNLQDIRRATNYETQREQRQAWWRHAIVPLFGKLSAHQDLLGNIVIEIDSVPMQDQLLADYSKLDADATLMAWKKLYGGQHRVGHHCEEAEMNVFLVVVWKQNPKRAELDMPTAKKRAEPVPKEGRVLREVVATSAENAERKVIAELGADFDVDTMEVNVASPFASE